MRRIALVNQKGGCGKTTIAINLASCLAGKGEKVLLIDLDPQGHSALGLGFEPDQSEKSIYEVLLGQIPINEAIQTLRENLDILFSDVVLSAFEQIMAGIEGREYKLYQCLKHIQKDYTYLIIDSPPSVGLLTFNGLMASSEIIIPVDPSSFSLNGLDMLLETIKIIEKKIKHQHLIKIIPNNIDLRTNFCKKMIEKLKTDYPQNCLKSFIHSCTALREAASMGKPIMDYDKQSNAFRDFQYLTYEIMNSQDVTDIEMSDISTLLETEGLVDLSTKGVIFSLEAPPDSMVQIAGDFNNWVPEALYKNYLSGKSVWQKAISLIPGLYEYKYVINGNWITDPANDITVDDQRGGRNSLITI